jgi:hypothetical protein
MGNTVHYVILFPRTHKVTFGIIFISVTPCACWVPRIYTAYLQFPLLCLILYKFPICLVLKCLPVCSTLKITPWRRINCFIKHDAMKTDCGVEVWLHAVALDGGECSVSHLGRFTPGLRDPCSHWTGGWGGGGSQSLSGRSSEEKKSHHCPCREMNPGRSSRSLAYILTELTRPLNGTYRWMSETDLYTVMLKVAFLGQNASAWEMKLLKTVFVASD